jgi:hypothetical protein
VKTLLPRLTAIAAMLVVLGGAYMLQLAGFEHPELEAFAAAVVAAILTVASGL